MKELGQEISVDFKGQEPVLIGILNGVIFFFADLMREISLPTRMDFIRAASYGSQMQSTGKIQLTKDVELPLHAKPVILVEDIIDTGMTLAHILQILERMEPESISVCALIDKLERRERPISIDYCGFQIEKGFVVGYGLDFDEQYRYLSDIYLLK